MKRSRSFFAWFAVFIAGFAAGIIFSAWKLERIVGSTPSVPTETKAQTPSNETLARISGLEKMLAANPNNLQMMVQLGNDYFDVGSHQKAVETYGKALKLDPKNVDVLTDMGISYRRLGKPQEAAASFRKALEVDPNHSLALFNLGLVLRDDLKDEAQALKIWETFLDKAGNSPHAVMVRPWVERLRGKVGSPKESKDSGKD